MMSLALLDYSCVFKNQNHRKYTALCITPTPKLINNDNASTADRLCVYTINLMFWCELDHGWGGALCLNWAFRRHGHPRRLTVFALCHLVFTFRCIATLTFIRTHCHDNQKPEEAECGTKSDPWTAKHRRNCAYEGTCRDHSDVSGIPRSVIEPRIQTHIIRLISLMQSDHGGARPQIYHVWSLIRNAIRGTRGGVLRYHRVRFYCGVGICEVPSKFYIVRLSLRRLDIQHRQSDRCDRGDYTQYGNRQQHDESVTREK